MYRVGIITSTKKLFTRFNDYLKPEIKDKLEFISLNNHNVEENSKFLAKDAKIVVLQHKEYKTDYEAVSYLQNKGYSNLEYLRVDKLK